MNQLKIIFMSINRSIKLDYSCVLWVRGDLIINCYVFPIEACAYFSLEDSYKTNT
jgi:hypothetical protein